MLIKLTVLCLCLHVFECVRPAYPRCKRIDTNITILNTLNGRIKGACYNISIKYSNNTVSINSPLLVWLSVPYARSPTGSLRFKSPQAAKSWSNVLNGLDFPYKCMQAPDVFDKEPKQLFQMGQFKKCNILSGYNNFEEISLAENEIGNEQIKDLRKNVSDSLQRAVKKRLSTDDTTANEIINFYSNRSNLDDCYMLFVKIITDHQYKCPTYELAKYYAQLNQSAYVYEYGHKLSVSENKPRVNGASHAEEIPILFAQPLFDHSYFTEAENLFSQRLVRYWGSFVSDGVPSLTDWPDFNGTSNNLNRNVLFLKSDNITNMIYLENDSVCKFWNNLSIAYVASQCGTIGVSFFLCFFLVILAIQTNRIE